MKRVIGIFAIVVLFFSCNKEKNADEVKNLFIHSEGNQNLFVSTKQVDVINSQGGGKITIIKGGSIINNRGICWSTNQNPTINNSHTLDGLGEGEFTSVFNGLAFGNTYYVRAYAATNTDITYGNQVSFLYELILGQNYAGGIIFSIDGTGEHGMVCAPSDQSTMSNWINAVDICGNLSLAGYNDWFLPSKDDLNKMYINLKAKGIGNFSDYWYWSSTIGSPYIWSQHFEKGSQAENMGNQYFYVRAVRSF